MAGRAIITYEEAAAWDTKSTAASSLPDSDLMGRMIDAASELLEQWTDRRFLLGTYEEQHDGDAAFGKSCHLLQTRFAPIVSVITLTENGVAKPYLLGVFSTPQSASDGVVIDPNGGLLRRVWFATPSAPLAAWAPGSLNVYIKYTAGWPVEGIPADVKQACCELAWLLYKQKDSKGFAEVSSVRGTRRFKLSLSDYARQVISNYENHTQSTCSLLKVS